MNQLKTAVAGAQIFVCRIRCHGACAATDGTEPGFGIIGRRLGHFVVPMFG